VNADDRTARRRPRGSGSTSQVVMEWLALGGLLLAAAGYVGFELRSSRHAIETTERDRLEHQARSAEKRLGGRLEAASNGLRSLAMEAPGLLRHADGVSLLNERMQVMASSMTGVRTFLLVNVDGIVAASSRKELIGSDWHDQERYRVIRSRPDESTVYISPPFMTPLGNWAISVGRAILDGKRAFDGYVLAIIDPAYFNTLLDSARYAPDMAAAIIHGDGKIVYRIPDPGGAVGLDLSALPRSSFNKHVKSGRSLTFWTAPVSSTGTESLIVLQSVRPSASPADGFLVAFFAREVATVLAPWRKEFRDKVTFLAVAALVSALGLYVFQRRREATNRRKAGHDVERRGQEKALRESEARLRLALDASHAGMWEWDVRTGRNVWSDALWELYGLDKGMEPPSYQAWRESLLPDDRETAEGAVAQAAANGTGFEIEYRVGGRGASVRWLLSRGRPVRGQGGEVERYTGIVVDITESKHATSLRVENARLDALAEAVSILPIGVAITELGADGEPRIVTTNAAQQRIVGSGATPGHSLSTLPYRAFQPDRVTPIEPRDWPGPMAARTGRPTPLTEIPLCLADGTWRATLVTAVPIARSTESTPRRAISLIVDVTAERVAAGALRASEALLKGITDTIPEPIFLKDLEGRWTFANPAALEVAGKSLDQVLGRTDHEIYADPSIGDALHEVDRRIMESGRAEVVEETVPAPDGLRVYLSTKAPFRDQEGRVVGLVGTAQDITDRKRAEEAVREHTYFLSESQRVGHVGSWTWDVTSNTALWSDEIYRMHGLSPSKGPLSYDLYVTVVHPDDRLLLDEWTRALGANNRPSAVEYRVVRPDGSTRVVRAEGEVTESAGGQPTRVVGTMQDITERTRVESALREREQLLALSQQAAHVGTWNWKLGETTVHWSDEIYRIYGLPPDMGPPDFEFYFQIILPEDRPAMRAWGQACAAGMHPPPVEFRVARPDGSIRVVETAGDVIEMVDGVPSRIAGTAHDVTERRKDEEALRASEASYQTLFREMQNGFAHNEIICDAKGRPIDSRYLAVNPAFERITGRKAGDVVGRTLLEVFPALESGWMETFGRVALTGEPEHFEMRAAELGITFDVSAFCPAPKQYACTFLDITPRKQAEAEIRELNRSLDQRVKERTAELLAANQELDSFAYAVSHDLRQPLRAMNGFSQALLEDSGPTLPGAAHEHLDEIILASRRMGALIDGLLRLSRTTRGELQRNTVALSAMAARIMGELAAAEPERHVTWTVAPGLTARGDERLIEVLMANLLGNAWKYTAKTPKPVIRVFAQGTGNKQVFCVADNGAGFDMQHAAKLFQPFQRLHREDEFPGVGIGLATAQRIVHRHGGSIRAIAVPGQGATFNFTLSSSDP
jgi:PAS domain S-box-containing protein